ncbi:MAG: prephenate dehydratase [Candidatus Gracilibacteria bacterium]|nr:prephenate dehydratase [Candidatus Gracilibacteria bacterium]
MKIFYQGVVGAYSYEASVKVASKLKISESEIVGVSSFKKVFDNINSGEIGVLPIENSYAGSVHENFYHIISGDYKIVGELYLDIDHYLLANTENIKDVKYVYAHPQAIAQCQNYLDENGFKAEEFGNNALAAKYVKESGNKEYASISSVLCASIYDLKVLDKHIQDQAGNTTRFFIVVSKETYEKKKKELKFKKNGKTSVAFRTKDTPSALYKCLGAFATRFINLSKIESLPAHKNRFEYIFWIDFDSKLDKEIIDSALDELKFFSKDLVILGDY